MGVMEAVKGHIESARKYMGGALGVVIRGSFWRRWHLSRVLGTFWKPEMPG